MEKGFRTMQCPGCPAKLRIPVSENDYGRTRIVRCPKCSSKGRVTIPHPAPEVSGTGKAQSSSSTEANPFPFDLSEDIFGDLFKKG